MVYPCATALSESLSTSLCTRSRCSRMPDISCSLFATACSIFALSIFAMRICSRSLLPSSCVDWSFPFSWSNPLSLSKACCCSWAFKPSASTTFVVSLLTSFWIRDLWSATFMLASSAAARSFSSDATFAFHVDICSSTLTFSSCATCTCCSIPAFLSFNAWTLLLRSIFSSSDFTTKLVRRTTSPWISARCCMSVALSLSPSAIRLFSWFLSSTMLAILASSSCCSDSTVSTLCMSSSAFRAMASVTCAFSCSISARSCLLISCSSLILACMYFSMSLTAFSRAPA
mmetsp:Transcript_17429/g.23530  ORF Transcript_17429/g.23530 Transcript_17429/m.23530 type:complete len:287 (+) Transcript_17429:263-1123(+)